MALAARSLDSINGDRLFVLVASGSLQRPCSRLSGIGIQLCFFLRCCGCCWCRSDWSPWACAVGCLAKASPCQAIKMGLCKGSLCCPQTFDLGLSVQGWSCWNQFFPWGLQNSDFNSVVILSFFFYKKWGWILFFSKLLFCCFLNYYELMGTLF